MWGSGRGASRSPRSSGYRADRAGDVETPLAVVWIGARLAEIVRGGRRSLTAAVVAAVTIWSARYVAEARRPLASEMVTALVELARVLELSKERYVPAYDIALIYAALADTDNTFLWLERALADGIADGA